MLLDYLHKPNSKFIYGNRSNEYTFRVMIKCDLDGTVILNLINQEKLLIFNDSTVIKCVMEFVGNYYDYNVYEITTNLFNLEVYYWFTISVNGSVINLGRYGQFENGTLNIWNLYEFISSGYQDLRLIPYHDSIYQILIDRFRNSESGVNFFWGISSSYDTHFGGNFKGIENKIDYLKQLGIDVLYLSPVFLSKSYHKYNVEDFTTIDSELGDCHDFASLIKVIHDNGMKVIIDIPFAFCSSDFPPFIDANLNRKKSEYYEWFHWNKENIGRDYKHFMFDESMPLLNFSSHSLRCFILSAIKELIIKYKVNGIRIDSAAYIPKDFLKILQVNLKSINSEILIIGEVWRDPEPWLESNLFDGAMSYEFRDLLVDYFAKSNMEIELFSNRIESIYFGMNPNDHIHTWRLIGSHDTPRFLTLANNCKKKLVMAAFVQFFFPGVPMIYYGDEIGLTGGTDPENRKPMPWNDEIDKELYSVYKEFIRIRNEYAQIKYGKWTSISKFQNRNIYAFKRFLNDFDGIFFYVNNSNISVEIHLDGPYKLIFTNSKSRSTNNNSIILDSLSACSIGPPD